MHGGQLLVSAWQFQTSHLYGSLATEVISFVATCKGDVLISNALLCIETRVVSPCGQCRL